MLEHSGRQALAPALTSSVLTTHCRTKFCSGEWPVRWRRSALFRYHLTTAKGPSRLDGPLRSAPLQSPLPAHCCDAFTTSNAVNHPALSDLKNNPIPPTSKISITIRSKALICASWSVIFAITPKISATSDAPAIPQPNQFLAL